MPSGAFRRESGGRSSQDCNLFFLFVYWKRLLMRDDDDWGLLPPPSAAPFLPDPTLRAVTAAGYHQTCVDGGGCLFNRKRGLIGGGVKPFGLGFERSWCWVEADVGVVVFSGERQHHVPLFIFWWGGLRKKEKRKREIPGEVTKSSPGIVSLATKTLPQAR